MTGAFLSTCNGLMTRPVIEAHTSRIIVEGSEMLGVPLDDGALTAMLAYLDMVRQWNARINLTSLTSAADIAVYHFLDSLTVFKVLPEPENLSILDVGTGAGFPGMVLRMANSRLAVTLLDRDPRKIVFLKHVVRDLALDGLGLMNRTLDNLIHDTSAPKFDVIVSRAFTSKPPILDLFASVLHPDGVMVRMAGPRSVTEACSLANFRQEALWEGVLPYSDRFRRVFRYSKRIF